MEDEMKWNASIKKKKNGKKNSIGFSKPSVYGRSEQARVVGKLWFSVAWIVQSECCLD